MSDPKPEKKPSEPKSFGLMAEYADENQLLDACRRVRDSGYTRTDAFTPFPVHGIDEALGIKPTVLPWFTLIAGATGTTVALSMEYFMNAVDYPYIISGKPFASWPAFIPVAFELTVLFAAFTTVFAMLGLNGLPKFSNPVFTNPKFDRTTDDRFFLWVDSRDKYFNGDKVQSLLGETDPLSVEEVKEDETSDVIPKPLILTIAGVILLTLVPGAIVLNMRNAKSGSPRFHVFFDMDFQPKKKPQTTTTIFADGRVQRPPVPGTVARGEVGLSDEYLYGYTPNEDVAFAGNASTRLVSYQEEGAQQPEDDESSEAESAEGGQESEGNQEAEDESATPDAASEEAAAPAAADGTVNLDDLDFVTEFPLPVTDELYELGKREFTQNCTACHGHGGYGDGLVSQRAIDIGASYWLQPTSIHAEAVQAQPIGQIYYTITNGKGKMGSYKASLTPKERWAVVLYVKALQRAHNAKESDVSASK